VWPDHLDHAHGAPDSHLTLRRRDDPYRQAKAEIWRRVSARCLAKRTRAILGVDVRELSSKCEVPMLCIHFADDKVVPLEFS
jgi:hypothetical protein